MARIEQQLEKLGVTLPEVAKPAGAYVPAVQSGEYVYTSGQLPFVDGEPQVTGRLGDGMSVEDGYEAAKIAAVNALAAIKSVIGDLDDVEQVVKVVGFVNSAADFTDHPKVINGASEFLGEVFGARGKHARSAVGVAALPMGTPVEVEMIVKVRSSETKPGL
ncbi:RidA family protein [Brevibacterium otitidis]|uniref:RidA family protein n=1 Tax=Brevibacterium otitidis TaxID=53364 RepID=A0ABV5WZF2_9MICO|nr:RidA family protein [Brevibacterium otitidis]